MDLFCAGGALVSKNPAKAFQSTLQAAQARLRAGARGGGNDVRRRKGRPAGLPRGWQNGFSPPPKPVIPRAAANYVGALRSGMGNLRSDTELAERWAKFLRRTRNTRRFPADKKMI